MTTRGWYWPWFLGAALLATVGVNVVMLFAATSDRNGAVVEPDYYRKAVEWDQTMARRAESDRLGWQVEVAITRASPRGALDVRLFDRGSHAVTGARVSAVLIHNADAGHPLSTPLREIVPGRYSAAIPIPHAGRWEVRVEARRDKDRFEVVRFPEVAAVGGAPR